MALINCKECSASIAENARCCPKCGSTSAHSRTKNWFEIFTTLSGPLILSAAGTVLAVNNDPDAPIWDHADIGIVGEWREVVPLLTAQLAEAM